MKDLASLSATKLLGALKNKRLSSLELLEFYIERLTRLNPLINAIVATDLDNARKRAADADRAFAKGEDWGALHGLPMTVKDNIPVVGMPSTHGMPIARDFMPSANSDLVESLLNAGAIIFGKTNLPFMAMDTQCFNDVYGQTHNPWDLTKTPGGSSGGSAAALAAGLTGLEMGNDLGGSIRIPAHFCGVCGHKPSYGIVSTLGGNRPWGLVMPGYVDSDYAPPLDMVVYGPLARGADDLKLAMDIIVGPPAYQNAAIKIALPPPRKTALREFRVGLWLDDPTFPPDAEVGKCLQNIADALAKAGAHLKTEKPDIDLGYCHRLRNDLEAMTMSHLRSPEEFEWAVGAAGALREDDQSAEARWQRATTAYHRDWNRLNQERALMRQKWADYFREFDVLLSPVVRIAAHDHDDTDIMERVVPFNGRESNYWDVIGPWNALSTVAYLPSTVVPIGFTAGGLPVGVQIIGPYLEDHTPIQFAMLLGEQLIEPFKVPAGFE
jgi:amidase